MSNENRVIATGVTGIYKGRQIEVHIGRTAAESHVLVNGSEITCSGVWIKIVPGKTTRMFLTFNKMIS